MCKVIVYVGAQETGIDLGTNPKEWKKKQVHFGSRTCKWDAAVKAGPGDV